MIRRIYDNISHGSLYKFWCIILVVSLVFSKFLISVALVVLCLLSIFRYSKDGFVLNRSIRSASKELLTDAPLFGMVLLFIIVVLSGINSDDASTWLGYVNRKLPYLLIPWVFVNHPRLEVRTYYNLYMILIVACSVSAVFVLLNYAIDFSNVTQSIGYGKSIPTPSHHNKYSVIIAVAAMSSIILWFRKYNCWAIPNHRIFLLLGLLLIIFLHILSVRSGLFALYSSTLILGSYYLLKSRKYILLALLICGLFSGPILAYKFIPSFQNKVDYTRYDFEMYRKGQASQYSDGERWISWQIAYQILDDHPLLGTGLGDIEMATTAYCGRSFSDISPKLAHNQFLFIATGMGIIGLSLFCMGYFLPLYILALRRDYLFLNLFLMITLLCMVEKPLERVSFLMFHVFFTVAAIRVRTDKS